MTRHTIMCDGILVKGLDGHSFCIPIVQYLISWPPHRPDPERFHQVIEDLTTIATISQAISRLHDNDVATSHRRCKPPSRSRLSNCLQASASATAR